MTPSALNVGSACRPSSSTNRLTRLLAEAVLDKEVLKVAFGVNRWATGEAPHGGQGAADEVRRTASPSLQRPQEWSPSTHSTHVKWLVRISRAGRRSNAQ